MTNKNIFSYPKFIKNLNMNKNIDTFLNNNNYAPQIDIILLKANSINEWNNFYKELNNSAIKNEYFNNDFFLDEIKNSNKQYDINNSIFIKDKNTNKIIGTFKYNLEHYIDKTFISAGIIFNFAYVSPEYRRKGLSKIIRGFVFDNIQTNIVDFINKASDWINNNTIIPADISLEMHCVSSEGQKLNQLILGDIQEILKKQKMEYFQFKNNTINFTPKKQPLLTAGM